MNFIKKIFREVWELIVYIFQKEILDTYKLKDPCPTCIVRACCTDREQITCGFKRTYLNTLDGYRSPLVKKTFVSLYLAWFVLFFVSMFQLLFK
jgi:hypothetical protein